jgi:hypothetical protein
MKREAHRLAESRREAMAWWGRPGVLVFLAALVLAALGLGLVLLDAGRRPVEEATIDGLHMRVVQARWLLDQMDHGENFQKPAVMMPDMPEWGSQRVTLEMSLSNRADAVRIFDGSEFVLVPEIGDEVPPIGATVGLATLQPGQTLNTALHFDFDTRVPHGRLQVEWRRGGETAYLPIPTPAEHYHLRPRGGEVALPSDARLLLPLGRAEVGETLYTGVFGCVACHGDPQEPGSNNVGPHLAGIAAVAGDRIEGVEAPQYIYDSIIDPGSFIAPECRDGQPCPEPSAMPEYGSLVNLQDAADLLAYLLELDG